MTARLDQVLAQARAAVLGRGVLDPFVGSGTLPIAQGGGTDLTVKMYAYEYYTPHIVDEVMTRSPATVRPVTAPAPIVRPSRTPPTPTAPSWPSCEAVTEGRDLSRGAGRVFAVLYRLACDTARARRYGAVPNQVVFHCPAVMVAAVVGYTDRHLRTLVQELERAGLLDAGGHAQIGPGGRWMYAGTVWGVKVKPGDFVAHVHPDEWKRTWRPDFKVMGSGALVLV